MIKHARILSRAARILAAITVVAALSACGTTHVRPRAPVKLSQITPADGSRSAQSTVNVSGRVKPRQASVQVDGRHVRTSVNGSFSANVKLSVGTNLIDVIAGAAHARPAMTALRVVRFLLVSVPSVGNDSPSGAAAAVKAAGLKPVLKGSSDPLSAIVPLPSEVCGQSPSAGQRVRPGTTVTISLGKVCL